MLAEGTTQGGKKCLGLPQYPGCTPHAGRGKDTSLDLNKLLNKLPLVNVTVHMNKVMMTTFIVTVSIR